ncbi:NAD-dependent epimerase/dehydratase family protein [Natronorarus salvus]|uniref:NAD-dependent epimerase/dehydratase family protein n=1 Tax=Natronorarus salvus TaxID=3117733 RepID=UPI002F269025
MKVAITGGTGFVGSHLLDRLGDDGHEVVPVARGTREPEVDPLERSDTRFVAASVTDGAALREAFAGCDAVAHLAGINHERGAQTYREVHVAGTKSVVEAATDAGVERLALTSYLRARPDCGSGYLESKWAAEEVVRSSDLEYTVVKPGVVYGAGDQMLRGLARSLVTTPVFPGVGLGERRVRPLAVADLVDVLAVALTTDRLSGTTVAVAGPEELPFSGLVRRVGEVIGRRPLIVPTPVPALSASAWLQERVMETPVVSTAGVRMLAEGATEPAPEGVCDPLPDHLRPSRAFSERRIAAGLPRLKPFGLSDLRW